jgi:hypothetical protein
MDAQSALDELALLSTQVVEAVIVVDGTVAGATTTAQRAEELAVVARELIAAAEAVRSDGAEVERVEVALPDGAVMAVRDGERVIVASTVPDATPGLVLYDLRTALRRSELPARPRSTRRRAPDGRDDA